MSDDFQSWLERLRRELAEVEPAVLASESGDATILDVRERDEWDGGHVPGAVHLARGFLELRVEQLVPNRDRDVVIYCAGGVRSLFAVEALQRLGYSNVRSLRGGFQAWKEAGLDFEMPEVLSDADRRRYSRHLVIPEVGEEGQRRLLNSRVLLIGAGGLGCPAALYLAAAGVGRLTILDDDVVDASNLQRQVLHREDGVGTPKVRSAVAALSALNSGIEIDAREQRFDSSNADELVASHDVVVDGTDNFATRYLINDACVKHRRPNVHGSVFRFEGQVTVFWPGKGPCYRCLYSEPPPPELSPNCAEAGVLGVLPGVVGLLEAVETLKLLLGVGKPLCGRLLLYDALEASFRELQVRPDPSCRYCAPGVEFPGYVDYGAFCAGGGDS